MWRGAIPGHRNMETRMALEKDSGQGVDELSLCPGQAPSGGFVAPPSAAAGSGGVPLSGRTPGADARATRPSPSRFCV